ncbi:hypothetical protein JOC34_000541 [Virgibacillus halotolerans]|uniref:hypothetical protein n=1 Tax=Virgibacillus halotolerans TaxID=1071053 RepID=UPI00196121DF|nr:hypothetical protein [Virgibacillus halotolerans]MBM7598184.1 hypothetical protein [Virgibacillus halotolerans]
MSEQIDLTGASVNIFLEIDGKIYAVAYEKDKYDAICHIIKNGAEHIIKTDKTQLELVDFIGIGG